MFGFLFRVLCQSAAIREYNEEIVWSIKKKYLVSLSSNLLPKKKKKSREKKNKIHSGLIMKANVNGKPFTEKYYTDTSTFYPNAKKKTLTTENNFLWYLRFYSTWSYFFLRKSSHFNHYSEDFISSHLKFPNFFLCDNVNVNVRSKTRRNQRFHQLWLQDRRKEQKKNCDHISYPWRFFFLFIWHGCI